MRPPRSVVAGACLFACVYIALDLNKLYTLRYGADTGTFVQFLTGVAHGRGSWNGAEYRPHRARIVARRPDALRRRPGA